MSWITLWKEAPAELRAAYQAAVRRRGDQVQADQRAHAKRAEEYDRTLRAWRASLDGLARRLEALAPKRGETESPERLRARREAWSFYARSSVQWERFATPFYAGVEASRREHEAKRKEGVGMLPAIPVAVWYLAAAAAGVGALAWMVDSWSDVQAGQIEAERQLRALEALRTAKTKEERDAVVDVTKPSSRESGSSGTTGDALGLLKVAVAGGLVLGAGAIFLPMIVGSRR